MNKTNKQHNTTGDSGKKRRKKREKKNIRKEPSPVAQIFFFGQTCGSTFKHTYIPRASISHLQLEKKERKKKEIFLFLQFLFVLYIR